MAKRYYQSKKDRKDESVGMMRRLGDEYYAGMKARRAQEMRDAGMISEDHSAIANLPQNVMMREYPKANYYEDAGLDDTMRGIDYQIDKDAGNKTLKRMSYPEKY